MTKYEIYLLVLGLFLGVIVSVLSQVGIDWIRTLLDKRRTLKNLYAVATKVYEILTLKNKQIITHNKLDIDFRSIPQEIKNEGETKIIEYLRSSGKELNLHYEALPKHILTEVPTSMIESFLVKLSYFNEEQKDKLIDFYTKVLNFNSILEKIKRVEELATIRNTSITVDYSKVYFINLNLAIEASEDLLSSLNHSSGQEFLKNF